MKNRLFIILGVVILLGSLWFAIYQLRSHQLDDYVGDMKAVADFEIEDDAKKVKALKVVVNDKTYTTEEFMKLKDFPVTADVIVAYEDGTMEDKSCYISFNDDVSDFTYRDGAYGRILLPSSLHDEGSQG